MTRWLQFPVGARYDRFDLTAQDLNTSIYRSREDDKIFAQGGGDRQANGKSVVLHGLEHLPSAGVGRSVQRLEPGTLILQLQKFENTEVGAEVEHQSQVAIHRSGL